MYYLFYKVKEAALWCIANSVLFENRDSQFELLHSDGMEHLVKAVVRYFRLKQWPVQFV